MFTKIFTSLLLSLLSFASLCQKIDTKQSDSIDNLLINSKFQEVIVEVDKMVVNQKDITNIITLKNKKAEALIGLGKLQEAADLLSTIEKELNDKKDNGIEKAITLRNIGFLQLNQGRSDLADESLTQALDLFSETKMSESLDAAQTHATLGLVYLSIGKSKQAEEQLQRALLLRQQQLTESDERIAASYNDLGLVYYSLDKDKALNYYEKALAAYVKIHGQDHPKIAIANINTGVIYRDMTLYGDAVNNFETALKIWEKTYTQPHPSKAIGLFNLGQTYVKMDDKKTAMAYYQKALDMYEKSYGNKHPEVSNLLNSIGNLEVSERHYASAFNYYQRALQANVVNFNNKDIHSNPPLEDYYSGIKLLQTLLFKAQAYEARYYGETLKFTDMEKSLDLLHLCDKLVDKLRQASNKEGDKLLLGIVASEVYADGVRIANVAGMNAFKKKQYYEDAFYFGEKSKNAVLLDAISESNAKSFAGIPVNLLEKEKELKSSIALFNQRLAERPSATEEKSIRENLFSINRTYEDFIKSLEKDFPEYFNLKYNHTSPSISQLKSSLDAKSLVLSYFIDDKDHTLYTFIISNKKFTIDTHKLEDTFDKTLTGYRNSLYYDDKDIFNQTAHALSLVLIPKRISSSVKNLVILPSGRLGVIPFEPLLTGRAEQGTAYSSLPYLVRKYTIQYEFSAGLMLQKAKSKSNVASSPSILLCAPVKFPAKDQLSELPGTKNEVEDIATLFTSKKFSSMLFTGMDASETLIKESDLKKYSYLHLATHGIVDESEPELSRIFLQTNSKKEDGNLFAGEIYNLELKANLVTLSACQTGLGKISKGEGVIGLSRALIYAGAQHLIVSFWSVADESTALLMKNFYTETLNSENQDFAESLRASKLQMIAKEKYAAPFYWAPFILIGY